MADESRLSEVIKRMNAAKGRPINEDKASQFNEAFLRVSKMDIDAQNKFADEMMGPVKDYSDLGRAGQVMISQFDLRKKNITGILDEGQKTASRRSAQAKTPVGALTQNLLGSAPKTASGQSAIASTLLNPIENQKTLLGN